MRNVGIFPHVILICELSEFPGSCKHFPTEIMCNINKTGISSFHNSLNFSLLTALSVRNTTALHHSPLFHVPGKVSVAVMCWCIASAGSSFTRLTPGIPLNPEETHKQFYVLLLSRIH